jgi:hypothetical protein
MDVIPISATALHLNRGSSRQSTYAATPYAQPPAIRLDFASKQMGIALS